MKRRTHLLGFKLPNLTEKTVSKTGKTYWKRIGLKNFREEFIKQNRGLLKAAYGEEKKHAENTGKYALQQFQKKFTNYKDYANQLLKATVKTKGNLESLIKIRLGYKTERYKQHIADLVEMHSTFYQDLLLLIQPNETKPNPDNFIYNGDGNYTYYADNGNEITFRFVGDYSEDQIEFTGAYA